MRLVACQPWHFQWAAVCLGLLLGAGADAQRLGQGAGLLLGDAALLMAHDAGTAYLPSSSEPVAAWTKTQPDGGFPRLLDCGARALDVRPRLDRNGTLIMRHGVIALPMPLRSAVVDVQQWALAHPGEVVLLYMSHFRSGAARVATRAMLADLGVRALLGGNCSAVLSLSLAEAARAGVVAVEDCVQENYAPDVVCEEALDRLCFSRPDGLLGADSRFSRYMGATAAAGPDIAHGLWMLQAHWQYNAEAVALGVLHKTSVLKDNQRAGASGLNAHVAAHLADWPRVGILEMNDVCDSGQRIYEALAARNQNVTARRVELPVAVQ